MYYFIFVSGLCIGSFLNVVIHRLPQGASLVKPRSHCPHCGYILAWYNLLPVLSYIFQKGTCTRCGAKISPRYPLVEMLTGFIFWLVYYRYGFSWTAFWYLVLVSLLVAASFIDLEHMIIPNEIIIAGIISGLSFMLKGDILSSLAGFFAGGGILYAIAILSKGNMGGGDIKLAAVIGLYLGWEMVFMALFWGFFLGTICGGGMIALGFMKRRDPFPFGPYLALGAVITFLWGDIFLRWYLNSFILTW